jgi:hypothetical protein
VSGDRYYTIRVDGRGWPDPEVGPDGPMACEDALARQTGPDPHSMWRTIALRVVDAALGVVVAEYGVRMTGGEHRTLTTTPRLEGIYPLADRIKAERRDHGKVYRRRIVVVDDWEEVDAP